MQAILLDAHQINVLTRGHNNVPVRDLRGSLVGRIVLGGQETSPSEDWVESWNEWYLQIEEEEEESGQIGS